MINIYNSKETNFEHNGLAVLDSCISCTVEEELNGYYGLELEYPMFSTKAKYLIEDNIIKAPTPTGLQLFRIYRKVKNMSSVVCYARHIFYDLLDNFIEDCRPTELNGHSALNNILHATQYSHKFKANSNIATMATAYYIRKNPIEVLIGEQENSFISRWGGELLRDNFNISILNSIGKDNGVTIAYAKNIVGIEEDLDMSEVATRIMPTGLTEGDSVIILPEKYIDSLNINKYPTARIRHLHFGDIKVNSEENITLEDVYKLLRERVKELYQIQQIDIPKVNYVIDFIELSKTEEYKDYKVLETVHLGDIVTVKHKKLDIDIKRKVVKYTWDSILNKYLEIELGNLKDNLAKETKKINNNIKKNEEDILDTKQDLSDAKEDLKETKEKTRSEFIKTNDRITLNVEEIGKTNAKLEITANQIRTEVNDVEKNLSSSITQTADKIMTYVINENDNMSSRITQTAKEIKLEVQEGDEKLMSTIVQTAENIALQVSDTEKELNSKIEITADGIESKVQDNYRDLSSWISQEADKIEMVVDGRGDIRAAKIALAISEDYSAISMIADRIEIKPHSGIIEFPYGQDIDCRGGDIRIRNSSNNYLRISGDFDFYNRGSILASITPSGIYFKGRRVKLEGEA
ncbi:phage tail spike protein [Clostridium tetani]|uniref:phage tail spike protein n=1 Tax=Clostridium tetani TaxID=1513 RepID=UPI0024A80A42|nr:phage tail spike protein [Clostridium tetani]